MLIKELAKVWKEKLEELHSCKTWLQCQKDGFDYELEIVFPLQFMACIATLRSNIELTDEQQEDIKDMLIQAVRDAEGQIAETWIEMADAADWNFWQMMNP